MTTSTLSQLGYDVLVGRVAIRMECVTHYWESVFQKKDGFEDAYWPIEKIWTHSSHGSAMSNTQADLYYAHDGHSSVKGIRLAGLLISRQVISISS